MSYCELGSGYVSGWVGRKKEKRRVGGWVGGWVGGLPFREGVEFVAVAHPHLEFFGQAFEEDLGVFFVSLQG